MSDSQDSEDEPLSSRRERTRQCSADHTEDGGDEVEDGKGDVGSGVDDDGPEEDDEDEEEPAPDTEDDEPLDEPPPQASGASDGAKGSAKRKVPPTAQSARQNGRGIVAPMNRETLQKEVDDNLGVNDDGRGYVVPYMKKLYRLPEEHLVLEGEPFAVKDGHEFSVIRNSKAPGQWRMPPDAVYMLRWKPGGEVYPYVCLFVADSWQAPADVRTLHPMPRKVAESYAQRIQNDPTMSDERRAHFKPISEYSPTTDPQIHPKDAHWKEAPLGLKLPTAEISPTPTAKKPKKSECDAGSCSGDTCEAESGTSGATGREATRPPTYKKTETSHVPGVVCVHRVFIAPGNEAHVVQRNGEVTVLEYASGAQ